MLKFCKSCAKSIRNIAIHNAQYDKCSCGNSKRTKSKVCEVCHLKKLRDYNYISADEIVKRNKEILNKWVEGQTLQVISTQYNITRERVRQIVEREIKLNGKKIERKIIRKKCHECKINFVEIGKYKCRECKQRSLDRHKYSNCSECGKQIMKQAKFCRQCAANKKSSLSKETVLSLIADWNEGKLLGKEIAKKYGITLKLANAITSGRVYKHITEGLQIRQRKVKYSNEIIIAAIKEWNEGELTCDQIAEKYNINKDSFRAMLGSKRIKKLGLKVKRKLIRT